MIVTILGLAAITLARVRLRQVRSDTNLKEAQLLAYSSVEQAVAESGYSYSTLQQKVAAGAIPNVGDKGRPRVRRRDLPRKAAMPAAIRRSGEPDLAGDVLATRL